MHYALRNKYPIEDSSMLKLAVEYFDKYLTRFDPADRALVAHSMEKRAAELGVNLDRSWVTNYSRMIKKASEYSPDFAAHMKSRKELCKTAQVTISGKKHSAVEVLDKLAAKKNEMPPVMMVAAIDNFDKLANINPHYDTRIADPIMTVYGSVTNPEYDRVKIATGLYDYDVIRASRNKETMEKVASIMGDEIADDMRGNPIETIEAMDPSEQEATINIIKNANFASTKTVNKFKKITSGIGSEISKLKSQPKKIISGTPTSIKPSAEFHKAMLSGKSMVL